MQDPRDVVEMFALQMPFLFRSVLDDHKLLRVFVTLLGSACNRHFANVLLRFLIDEQMPALNRPDSKVGPMSSISQALKVRPKSQDPGGWA